MTSTPIDRTEGYDIIGDIHGHADELKRLLNKLGYSDETGAYRHPKRQAVFVGDFIDRGPKQIETINIVRPMIEQASALSVMGNHEYNAICYATPSPSAADDFLRPHSRKNFGQHQKFIEAVPFGEADHRDLIDWFKTLPIYLDLEDLRIVHACWHDEMMETLSPWLDGNKLLSDEGYVASSDKISPAHQAIEVVLKGLEAPLPPGHTFTDKDGNERSDVRVKWWLDHSGLLSEVAVLEDDIRQTLPDIELDPAQLHQYLSPPPVFFGHYWLKGEPLLTSDYAACLDFSVAKEGYLCAYRWSGENKLKQAHLTWV
jgi:hypothetical protein